MGNMPCCEGGGGNRPSGAAGFSADSSDDSDDEESSFMSRTQTARSGKLSIDTALQDPGTPSATKKKGGKASKGSRNANLINPSTDKAADRRRDAMKKADKARRREEEEDESDSESGGSSDSSGSDSDGARTPPGKSRGAPEPLGAPRGKKHNSLLGGSSDDHDDEDEDDKNRKKKKKKKKRDKEKGKREGNR